MDLNGKYFEIRIARQNDLTVFKPYIFPKQEQISVQMFLTIKLDVSSVFKKEMIVSEAIFCHRCIMHDIVYSTL